MTTLERHDLLRLQIARAVHDAVNATERAQQQADHRLGVSDLGGCREYGRLMTTQTPFSDSQPKWAAFIGTALGDHIEAAIQRAYPEARRGVEVTVRLPMSDAIVNGHPDLVLPNGVIDVKTTAELSVIKRTGPSQSHQFQRHLYCWALIEAGEIPEEHAWVANVYFDRTGEVEEPYVDVEPFRYEVVAEADQWVSDVIYAVLHGEQASKDRPIPWCAKACPFFTVCRGPDLDSSGGVIDSSDLVEAVQTYVDGSAMRKQGTRMVEDAKRALAGIEGSTGQYLVRWIHIDDSDVPGFARRGHDKIDIRRIPRAEQPG